MIQAARERYSRYKRHRFSWLASGLVLFTFLALLPLSFNYQFLGWSPAGVLSVKILILTLIWAYAAQSWNIMSGYTGQFSFGHAAFFGIGAYVTMFLLVDYGVNPWVGMFAGGLIATGYAAIIGSLSFRYDVSGHYFALLTLAFAELIRNIVLNVSQLNGPDGFFRPFPGEYADGFGLFAFQFQGDLPYYYLILAFLLFVTALSYGIKQSAIGTYFVAIKEDETAAASMGIPVYRYKMLGFLISAFFTAWAGTFWSMYYSTVQANGVFGVLRNVEILLPAIIGGPGTVLGPIVGAFLVIPLGEWARTTFTQIYELHRLIFGLALILVVMYSPDGVLSWPRRLLELFGLIDTETQEQDSTGATQQSET
jgi:branched-chain amino acid transport system permease protein